MNFPSKTEREIVEESLFAKGDYDATVTAAEDGVSKAGNDMIVLTLRVYRDDGRTLTLRDWLLPSIPMKLLKFCQSSGLTERYEKGELRAADCVERDVCVSLKVEEDESGQYPPQNKVSGYKVRTAPMPERKVPAPAASPVSEEPVFDPADVPF